MLIFSHMSMSTWFVFSVEPVTGQVAELDSVFSQVCCLPMPFCLSVPLVQ